VGPVNAGAGEAVGPVGSVTTTRMDKFVCPLLAYTGLLAMKGKAEREPYAIADLRCLPQRYGRRGLPALALHHLVTRAGIR
jgi:tartrate dehydratase beta subunit/fumarate hydratase class I family protein